ncbi:GlcG/HbpS family heme-binding protein [Jiangella alkaliphila]|uniref:Uncharacterized conserved protein GlcG, DUF336 family n=1 Tax=Jiangella alkaliphila TaxID=419479 RepID=A0A1H2LDL2_9ACTN|nr:heme-binding protein [Jiangella alkaliphila]SDU79130.1 Uncharacterized conserved protein GlcG, DUF336 family [Jiangella alkaliphila]
MLGLAAARTIVAEALDHARSLDLPPMTVAVLDAGGHLVTFVREDGSSLYREAIARGKAMGALGMGTGSRTLQARAAAHPEFINAVTVLAGGALVPVPGGVLIRSDDAGRLVGAVGVSGHLPDADEACAVAGIVAAGLSADTGAGS